MNSFYFLWQLVEKHGGVANNYKVEAAQLWDTFSLEQQRYIYRCIRDKLRAGKFVNYNPVLAIKENAPKQRPVEKLSPNEYYNRFGTTEDQGGWRRTWLPNEQRSIYIKEK